MANTPTLPIFQPGPNSFIQMQNVWSAALKPVIQNQINQGLLIQNISLSNGIPKTINHRLSRQQIGWQLVDISANANVWRTEPLNNQTLILQSSADVTISLWVF